jgi:micrococcal nuclease
MRTHLLFLLISVLTFTACDNKVETSTGTAINTTGSQYYPVKKVVDGDTFWADDGSEKGVKVRLIGVNTPENHKSPHKDIERFGQEAQDYLTNLLTGKRVKLVNDVDRLDQYGRTLSYVYLEDGTFVNALLVKEGYAQVMTIPPNVAHAEEFVQLQREARENKRGMWAEEPVAQ